MNTVISNMFKTIQMHIRLLLVVILFTYFFFCFSIAEAATLSISPNTGVYTTNGTFTARIAVNTQNKSINAAEGTITFNPKEVTVVSVNRTGSIFNLWVTEPTFSNSAGTITFSGGLPAGYTGQSGTIMNVTFRSVAAGTTRVNFKSGSVLANDGRGTNILDAMSGGTYTMQAVTSLPEPEMIEYVAPANTPGTPQIQSTTHADPAKWYAVNEAILGWTLPSDVVAVRTLLDQSPTTIPTKVYDDPVREITLSDLPEGISYFHLQFKNADGWGRVAHYRLGVDTKKPESIAISHPDDADFANPAQVLLVKVEDETSLVQKFKVKIDAEEPFELIDETGSSTISLPALKPGYHSVIIEAFDEAGNSIVGTYSFTILAFEKPIFTDYPTEINEEVIPVIKGLTRPSAEITVFLRKVGGDTTQYTLTADDTGEFIFIPEGTFRVGVYELSAQATDVYGAQSEVSDMIRIAVQQPGYLRIGSLLINVLSVVVPLIVLVIAFMFSIWYLVIYARRFRKQVTVESAEALSILQREFVSLQNTVRDQESKLRASRATNKLTKAETTMIETINHALLTSKRAVEKEIEDITELTVLEKDNK